MSDNHSPAPCRVVVLLSGSGSNLQAVVENFRGDPTVLLAGVVSNRAEAGGLVRAREAGIRIEVVSHLDYEGREDFDQALIRCIDELEPDLVVLAGFMRILTTAFVLHYEGRLLNIHPSLLPRHRGLRTHQRALDAGDREHGATVHFVTAELDGGPSIVQARLSVNPGDTPERLAQRVLVREHQIYPIAIRLFCEGRIKWRDHACWFDGQPMRDPIVIPDSVPEDDSGSTLGSFR